MLDGGHLLFYFFEAIKGKPLSEKTQEFGFRIGLALVLMLMIFATMNDLIHIKCAIGSGQQLLLFSYKRSKNTWLGD